MANSDFIQTLMEMRNGAVAADCARKFSELVGAVMETSSKGVLKLDVTITPSRVQAGGVVEVELESKCRITKPELPIGKSIFYPWPDGSLRRQDPSQAEFDFEKESSERE